MNQRGFKCLVVPLLPLALSPFIWSSFFRFLLNICIIIFLPSWISGVFPWFPPQGRKETPFSLFQVFQLFIIFLVLTFQLFALEWLKTLWTVHYVPPHALDWDDVTVKNIGKCFPCVITCVNDSKPAFKPINLDLTCLYHLEKLLGCVFSCHKCLFGKLRVCSCSSGLLVLLIRSPDQEKENDTFHF